MSTLTAPDPPPGLEDSHKSAHPTRNVHVTQVVGFQLANEEYGLDIMKVQEIILIGAITQVPQVPDFVRGLINLRGHVLPIIDLRRRFGLPDSEPTEDQRIIIVNVEEKTLGIVVDAVTQVTRMTDDQIEPPPTSVSGIGHECITGLAKLDQRLVILLDIERLLAAEDGEALAAGTERKTKAGSA